MSAGAVSTSTVDGSASTVGRLDTAGEVVSAMPSAAAVEVQVPAEDGVVLATDLYRPDSTTARPAVLLRTYLGKSQHRGEAQGWARAGYLCCVQDVRGRYGSSGDWRPFQTEHSDGASTVRWLAAHPWCDGRIVLAGGSYGAFTAWAAAVSGHPGVRAVISSVPAMRPVDVAPTGDGVVPLLGHLAWWATHGSGQQFRPVEPGRLEDPGLLSHLPVAEMPARSGLPLDGWLEAADAAHGPAPIRDSVLARLRIASLHVGGWHDPFIGETLRLYGLVGAARRPRPTRRLIVGPWGHNLRSSKVARYGERNYGPASRLALGRMQARWVESVLEGRTSGADPAASQATVFVTGANRWTEGSWPSEPLAETRFFAASDGTLVAEPPAAAGSKGFVYDPTDPFPARRTPIDERDLSGRRDVVRFTTAPLDAALIWVGGADVELWASSDAESTDWVARVLEVTAEGRRLFLAYGIVDAERHQRLRGHRLVPGEVLPYRIRLAPMAVRLPAGHRLCLEVASSAFPSHVRNLGGGDRLRGRRPHRSRQSVHWGGQRPTQVRLRCRVDPGMLG